jgi:hypothetical protein
MLLLARRETPALTHRGKQATELAVRNPAARSTGAGWPMESPRVQRRPQGIADATNANGGQSHPPRNVSEALAQVLATDLRRCPMPANEFGSGFDMDTT